MRIWIDYARLYEVRRVFLECARRLAADGGIEQPEDVFYLTLEELRETPAGGAGTGPAPARPGAESRARAFPQHTPAPALGTEPSEPAGGRSIESRARQVRRHAAGAVGRPAASSAAMPAAPAACAAAPA